MMHAFALLMDSILSHSWAKALVSKAQRVAIYFHSHTKAKAIFKEQKAAMRIPGGFPSRQIKLLSLRCTTASNRWSAMPRCS
jgi:hypothetical protein